MTSHHVSRHSIAKYSNWKEALQTLIDVYHIEFVENMISFEVPHWEYRKRHTIEVQRIREESL